MMTKTIVLWGNDDLLSSYVEQLLTAQQGWKVVNLPIEKKLAAVLQVVDKVNPDIVIIQLGERFDISSAPTILLRDHPNMQVLTLSLNNNLMEVFSKQDIQIESPADLISAIVANQ